MEGNLKGIVDGFDQLDNITSQMVNIDAETAEIETIRNNMRSLELLQEITDQIQNTGILPFIKCCYTYIQFLVMVKLKSFIMKSI